MAKLCHPDDKDWVDVLTYRSLTKLLYKFIHKSFSNERALFDKALVHSCFFAWSFLNERGYIHRDGFPTMKSDMQNRLHYKEPHALILTEMLMQSIDDTYPISNHTLLELIPAELLDKNAKLDEDAQNEFDLKLLSILDYLLADGAPCSHGRQASYRLPDVVRTIWKDYSSVVLDQFTRYMQAQATCVKENALPFSSESSYNDINNHVKEVQIPQFFDWCVQNYYQYDTEPRARSVYAGLSGNHDKFEGIDEMISTVKGGIFVSSSIIPTMEIPVLTEKRILTVYTEGSFEELEGKDRDNDAKPVCEEFSSCIRKVRASIQKIKLVCEENNHVLSDKANILLDGFLRVIDKFCKQHNLAVGKGIPCIGVVTSISSRGNGFVVRIDDNSFDSFYVRDIYENPIPEISLYNVVSFFKVINRAENDHQYSASCVEKYENVNDFPVSKFTGVVITCDVRTKTGIVKRTSDGQIFKIFGYFDANTKVICHYFTLPINNDSYSHVFRVEYDFSGVPTPAQNRQKVFIKGIESTTDNKCTIADIALWLKQNNTAFASNGIQAVGDDGKRFTVKFNNWDNMKKCLNLTGTMFRNSGPIIIVPSSH
jgi:hypothetical protein